METPQQNPSGRTPIKGRRNQSLIGQRLNSRANNTQQHELGFVGHLIELRNRLIKTLLALLVIFLPLAVYSNELYNLLSQPLLANMPKGTSMIATAVTSPFLAPLKFAMVMAAFLGMPVILYHLWAFIAPGLYRHERRMIFPLLFGSVTLFYSGVLFAYYFFFPMVFAFFVKIAPQGVAVMTDINSYLDFVLSMFFAFGITFQVPIITIVLVWAGVVTPDALAEKRRYVIVGAFVVATVLTPPDIFSQFFLAVPMCLLFEVGLLLSRMVVKQQQAREADEDVGAG
jgi:sec-independent protein translocase protein TatC